jgi:hypothetical protein
MNINHKDLGVLYQSFVGGRLPESRENCPPLNDLIKFFKPRTPRRRKTKIVDHITRCAPCAQEFDLILKIKRRSELMDQEIAMWLDSKIPSRESFGRPKMVFSHRFWRYAAVLVGFASLSLAVLTFINNNPVLLFKQQVGRGHIESDIRLIEPINARVEKSHFVFRWQEYDGADSYEVELFDESLRFIWKSPKLGETKYILPSKILQKLAPSHIYFWMITINMKNRSVIESELVYFVVADGSTKINS